MIYRHEVYPDRIKVYDIDTYLKDNYECIIYYLAIEYPTHPLFFSRKMKSLIREMATHSLLYKLGIARERTKDVDLNVTLDWYAKVGYFIVGSCALLVLK